MPTLISGSRVREAIEGNTFIIDGTAAATEAVKYDFHMGSRVLKAEFGQPLDFTEIPLDKRWIAPGEVVFVLTREKVCLKRNMIALLSPKRKLAHRGIMALGGLAVDPEYKGVLVIGLYNFSSTPFPLQPDIRIIAASFYELSEGELVQFPVAVPQEITDFPAELVSMIRSYRPIELTALQEDLKLARQEIAALKTDFLTDKTWKDQFKEGLETHNRQLGTIIEGLREERESRAREDERIHAEVRAVETRISGFWTTLFSSFKIAWVIGGMIVAAAVTVIIEKLWH